MDRSKTIFEVRTELDENIKLREKLPPYHSVELLEREAWSTAPNVDSKTKMTLNFALSVELHWIPRQPIEDTV